MKPDKVLGEEEIQEDHVLNMSVVADVLGEVFAGYGFCLLVFPFEEEGRVNYVSNADRKDMLNLMKEFLARNEGRYMEENFSVKH